MFYLLLSLGINALDTVNSQSEDQDIMCCSQTSYTNDWLNCKSAADPNIGRPTNCSTSCLAYQCIDWTVGSIGMRHREAALRLRTGIDAYLGVGSYGNNNVRAGLCYRITASSLPKDIIVQVINQGGDVPDGNFDLQMGDGGFGLFNGCVYPGTTVPQFDGSVSQWGSEYGGWPYDECSNLPAYPHCNSESALDSLQELCRYSFSQGFRYNGGGNPTISSMCQVSCPDELWQATGLRRSDDSIVNSGYTCLGQDITGGGSLTRMMDCAKPSYAWENNVNGPTFPGYTAVVPCRRDGYTRINALTTPSFFTSQPSASSTLSVTPSIQPSIIPPFKNPTTHPTSTLRPRQPSIAPSKTTTKSNKPSSPLFRVQPTCIPNQHVTLKPSKARGKPLPPTPVPTIAPTSRPPSGPTKVTALHVWEYIGCYTDEIGNRQMQYVSKTDRNSIEFCEAFCETLHYIYSGLQYSQECWCANTPPSLGSSNNCDMPCTGNKTQTCGGPNALSVFLLATISTTSITTIAPSLIGVAPLNSAAPVSPRTVKPAFPVPSLTPLSSSLSQNVWSYIGCYTDDIYNRQMQHSETTNLNTIEFCEFYCNASNYIYSGLQYSQECWCSNTLPSLGASSNCDMPCTGNQTQICGGPDAISVFQSIKSGSPHSPPMNPWSYVGCYTDDISYRQMSSVQRSALNSIGICQAYCLSLSFYYSGLQYTNECWCANTLPQLGISNNCNMPCNGIQSQICGGPNALSVYKYKLY